METLILKHGSQVIARISANELVCGKKVDPNSPRWQNAPLIDDLKMLKVMLDGKPAMVLYISANPEVTVERECTESKSSPML